MLTKATVRQRIKECYRQHTFSELQVYSQEIMTCLEEYPRFQDAQSVLLFHSLTDEPDTHTLIDKWCNVKRIYLPACEGDILQLRLYSGQDGLHEGAFKIMEPQGLNLTEYSEIDLAIIPGVAFDEEGHRLGRGKGYYDRLLAHPAFANVYKLGVAFPYQMLEAVPHSIHDIKMNEIFNPKLF